ncbi:hypothetical protein GCM10009642_17470 [Nocardiopsis metallicus]
MTLETHPGQRDEDVVVLSHRNSQLEGTGCLLYQVGVTEARPLVTGRINSEKFDVAGSPLRD